MADDGMFGTPTGTQAYDEGYRKDLVTSITAAQHLGQIAMQPGQQRLIEAHAGKAEMELEAEKRFAAEMAKGAAGMGGPGGKPMSMADQLNSLAWRAAQAGLVTKAGTLASQAAMIGSREATMRAAGAKYNETQLDIVRKQATVTGQLFGGVDDEASWTRANALYEFQTGQRSPYAGVPYNEELVKTITDQALSAKDRADALQKASIASSLATFRRARLDQHDAALEIAERRAELAAQREARLAKAGGGRAVAGPVRGETDQVARLIRKDYSGIEAGDLNDASYQIAAEARALRRSNPALDASAAIQQAYAAAVQAGDFQTGNKSALGIDIPGTTKTSFTGRGKSAAVPLPFTKGVTLTKDRYYSNAAGVVGKWNGKMMVIGAAPDTEDDNADDEEE